MTSLPDLITELEALEGPSREMDARIGHAVNETSVVFVHDGERSRPQFPCYTASIDAAVALAERVLPEWDWTIQDHGAARVYRYEPKWDEFWEHECEEAANPATALVVAALRALAQEKGDG